jgi:hypothetical protein
MVCGTTVVNNRHQEENEFVTDIRILSPFRYKSWNLRRGEKTLNIWAIPSTSADAILDRAVPDAFVYVHGHGLRTFLLKSRNFGLGQTNQADKFWDIWGILD